MNILRKIVPASVRGKIRRGLNWPKMKRSTKIIIGAGGTKQEGWASCDIDTINITRREDFLKFWQTGTLSNFLAEHVWEHLTPNDGRIAIEHCFELLAPSGRLRIAVPDGNSPDPAYIDHVRIGGTGPGGDDHKILYTVETLSEAMSDAGFVVEAVEYFDSEGHFHQNALNAAAHGYIGRSRDNDPRNTKEKIGYTSLIVDGVKPKQET